MKITGEVLKAARLSQNLTPQDIAGSLKLSTKLVIAIEEGNLKALPAKTFVRGFVKSYAQLLKLDVDSVLRQFQEEMGSTNPMPKVPPPMPNNQNDNTQNRKPNLKTTSQNQSGGNLGMKADTSLGGDSIKKTAVVLLLAIAMIAVLIIANRIFDRLKTNPVAISNEASPKLTVPALNDANGTASASLVASSSDDTTNKVGGVPSNAASETLNEVVAPSSQSLAIVKNEDTTLESGFQKSTLKPTELILEAKKDLEVFYSKTDRIQFTSVKLRANQIFVLRSKNGLYLKTSDAGSLKLILNGEDIGLAGAANKTVKLSF